MQDQNLLRQIQIHCWVKFLKLKTFLSVVDLIALELEVVEEQGINMGESRIHLGRFAKNFAQVQQKARNAEKAASVPPPKHKTYDDIEKEIEEVVPDPIDTRLRKKPQFPAGAFLKRERLDSEGRKSLRYQGMPIRV